MSQDERDSIDIAEHIPAETLATIRDREDDLQALAEETDNQTIADGIRMLVSVAHEEPPDPNVIQRLATTDAGDNSWGLERSAGPPSNRLTPGQVRRIARRILAVLNGERNGGR